MYTSKYWFTRAAQPLCSVKRYSGKTLEATPWESVPAIQEILAATEAAAGVCAGYFNCVLLNWYRDGGDYMGWHSGGRDSFLFFCCFPHPIFYMCDLRPPLYTYNREKIPYTFCFSSWPPSLH